MKKQLLSASCVTVAPIWVPTLITRRRRRLRAHEAGWRGRGKTRRERQAGKKRRPATYRLRVGGLCRCLKMKKQEKRDGAQVRQRNRKAEGREGERSRKEEERVVAALCRKGSPLETRTRNSQVEAKNGCCALMKERPIYASCVPVSRPWSFH